MRTQTIAVVACLVVVFMVASPAMANRPIPIEKIEHFTDDPSFDPTIGIYELMDSLPIMSPFFPSILVPAQGEPVMDENEYIPIMPNMGHDQKAVNKAR